MQKYAPVCRWVQKNAEREREMPMRSGRRRDCQVMQLLLHSSLHTSGGGHPEWTSRSRRRVKPDICNAKQRLAAGRTSTSSLSLHLPFALVTPDLVYFDG